MTFTNEVRVCYDGKKRVQIVAPPSMYEKVCGLCGDNNGDEEDDMVIGPVFEGSKACGEGTACAKFDWKPYGYYWTRVWLFNGQLLHSF